MGILFRSGTLPVFVFDVHFKIGRRFVPFEEAEREA